LTTNEIKQVVQSIERSFKNSIKVTAEDTLGQVYRLDLPFRDRNGAAFRLWAFRLPRSKKIQLSDGRELTKSLSNAGPLNLQAVQALVGSYGVSLMEDLSLMEISKRPLTQRVTSMLQVMVAVDGVLRMWDKMTEKKQ
jgi:hypothetical protein